MVWVQVLHSRVVHRFSAARANTPLPDLCRTVSRVDVDQRGLDMQMLYSALKSTVLLLPDSSAIDKHIIVGTGINVVNEIVKKYV